MRALYLQWECHAARICLTAFLLIPDNETPTGALAYLREQGGDGSPVSLQEGLTFDERKNVREGNGRSEMRLLPAKHQKYCTLTLKQSTKVCTVRTEIITT